MCGVFCSFVMTLKRSLSLRDTSGGMSMRSTFTPWTQRSWSWKWKNTISYMRPNILFTRIQTVRMTHGLKFQKWERMVGCWFKTLSEWGFVYNLFCYPLISLFTWELVAFLISALPLQGWAPRRCAAHSFQCQICWSQQNHGLAWCSAEQLILDFGGKKIRHRIYCLLWVATSSPQI